MNDKKRQGLVDSLLSLPVYDAISEVLRIHYKNALFTKRNTNTYYDAFNNLPLYCVPMNGGRPISWLEYWNEGYQTKVESLIEYIQKNMAQIIETTI